MAGSDDDGRLSVSELGQAARAAVEELTGFDAEAVTGLERDGELWQLTVEALELSRIPNTSDVIGTYEVQLDDSGTLRGYRRTGRHSRGQVDTG
jgi:Gas vesicle synthesis protein GvpO